MFGRSVYHWWSFDEIEEEVRHAWRAADTEYEKYRTRLHQVQQQHADETVYLRQHNEAMMKAISEVAAVQPSAFGMPPEIGPLMPYGTFKIVSARKP